MTFELPYAVVERLRSPLCIFENLLLNSYIKLETLSA